MKWFITAMLSFLAGIALVMLTGLIPALIVMLAWNGVVPAVFGLTTITYWQAYGLYLLCSCLIRTKVETKTKEE